jgi:hypothetical protein
MLVNLGRKWVVCPSWVEVRLVADLCIEAKRFDRLIN